MKDQDPALTWLTHEISREQRSLDEALRLHTMTSITHAVAMDELRFVLARIALARLISERA